MRYRWPEDTTFDRVEFEPEDRDCPFCRRFMHLCDHRHHQIFTLSGPVHIVSKLAHCPTADCPGHRKTFSPDAEMQLTMRWWLIGWDVFAWIGHRRVARHWSVAQIRAELLDSYAIVLSDDSIERYIHRYQTILAARQQDPDLLAKEYRDVEDLILSIDGLQPEKGHETLYVVRELRRRRVWFAESLLSSSAAEVRRLLAQARQWAERLERPVRLWISDKQDGFVTGIAEEFPGVGHRYCQNHFLRDLAKPVLEADSHAKVKMRQKVRGLRTIEREVLEERRPDDVPTEKEDCQDVVLDYCTAVRGILNDDQGGPLDPPGLRMAGALDDVRVSLQRNLDAEKGGESNNACGVWPGASTEGCRRSKRPTKKSGRTSKRSTP